MHFFWRRSPFVVQQPCLDAPGDPAGGGGQDPPQDPTAHPDYDVDLGDGFDDDPANPAAPGAPATPPVQDPSRPGAPGQDPRTPPAADPVLTALQQSHTQLQTNFQTVMQQNQRLMQTVAALTGRPVEQPPAAPQGPPLSDADQRAIDSLYRLLPGLKPLLENHKDLLQVPGAINQFQQDAQSRWQDLGTRMWGSFDTEVKKAYGETPVPPFAARAMESAFVNWLETDKAAAARYRSGDLTLATEFMTNYMSGLPQRAATPPVPGAPPRPGAPNNPGPGQPRRAAAPPPRVPRGGPGAPPVGQLPQQPNAKKPDELHNAAADAYFAQR